MCWQCHGRIFHSPGTWQWGLCTPRGSTGTIWENGNYFPLTWEGRRWTFKASVQEKNQPKHRPPPQKKKQTKPKKPPQHPAHPIRSRSSHFWARCGQRRLLPAVLQQRPGHGLLLPAVPREPREPRAAPGRGGSCPAPAELSAAQPPPPSPPPGAPAERGGN